MTVTPYIDELLIKKEFKEISVILFHCQKKCDSLYLRDSWKTLWLSILNVRLSNALSDAKTISQEVKEYVDLLLGACDALEDHMKSDRPVKVRIAVKFIHV